MKKNILIIAFTLASVAAANAQGSFWSFSYPMSMAFGETAEFVGQTSFRGFGIDGRSFINDNLSIGGLASWEVFDEIKYGLPPQPITDENGNVVGQRSGTPYTYLNTIPLMVNTHYYTGSYGAVQAFFGLGVGTIYVDEREDVGLFTTQTKKWRFGVQPEVGVYIPFGLSSSGATVSLKYRYGTKAGNETREVNMMSLSIGLGFMN